MTPITLTPVGVIRSEHQCAEATPAQPVFACECTGRVELLPEYAEGLQDIDGFSHIILLYWLHKATPGALLVKPLLDDALHGVFATRYPGRPNAIGLSVVRLVRHEGSVLHILGVDILDGTPLLDIKPYSSVFDSVTDVRNGWLAGVDAETAQRRGRREYRAPIEQVTAP